MLVLQGVRKVHPSSAFARAHEADARRDGAYGANARGRRLQAGGVWRCTDPLLPPLHALLSAAAAAAAAAQVLAAVSVPPPFCWNTTIQNGSIRGRCRLPYIDLWDVAYATQVSTHAYFAAAVVGLTMQCRHVPYCMLVDAYGKSCHAPFL